MAKKMDDSDILARYSKKIEQTEETISKQAETELQKELEDNNPYSIDPYKTPYKRISLAIEYDMFEEIQAIVDATGQSVNGWVRQQIEKALFDPDQQKQYNKYLEQYKKRETEIREQKAKESIKVMAFWWQHIGSKMYDVQGRGVVGLKPFLAVQQNRVWGWIDVTEVSGYSVRYEIRGRKIISSDKSYAISLRDVKSEMTKQEYLASRTEQQPAPLFEGKEMLANVLQIQRNYNKSHGIKNKDNIPENVDIVAESIAGSTEAEKPAEDNERYSFDPDDVPPISSPLLEKIKQKYGGKKNK